MALVERDYVMRLVKQLALLLERMLRLRQDLRYDEAAQTLEGGCLDLLGLEFSTLVFIDSASAAGLLGAGRRICCFARLLEELAEVHRAAGDEAKARARARHALEMYREALARDPGDTEARGGVERLLPKVAG